MTVTAPRGPAPWSTSPPTTARRRRWGTPAGAASRCSRSPTCARMEAEGDIDEADAGRVAVGQRVTFRLDAHPDDVFTGRVRSIGGSVQSRSERNPLKVVRLEIDLDRTDPQRMRPGMRFLGTIEIEQDRQGAGGAGRGGVQQAGRPGGLSQDRLAQRGGPPRLRARATTARWRSGAGSRPATWSPGAIFRRSRRRRDDEGQEHGRSGWAWARRRRSIALIALAPSCRSRAPPARTCRPCGSSPRSFVRSVPAQGDLQAVRATPISVPNGVPGPFRIGWLAPDGSLVKKGDVVIRFDPSVLEKRLVDAEDDLHAARLQMEKEQLSGLSEVRKLEKDAAMARVELAQASQFQKKDSEIFSRSRDHRVGHRPEARRGAAEARRGVAADPRAAHRHRGRPAPDQGPPGGRQDPAGAGGAPGALRDRAPRRRADPQAQLARRHHPGGGQRLERPAAGRDPRSLGDGGRGLRAGGGRRRPQGRQDGHGRRRVGARGHLSGPHQAGGHARQAAHPRLAGAVFRRHPGARRRPIPG